MTIHRLMTASFFCATLVSGLTPVFALDVAQVPTSKRTKPGLYLDVKEAYEMKQQQGDKVLFVDIRTRGEITYTGVATSVDAYVPMYEHPPNAKGLSKSDPIVLICRSGDRSGRAATQLSEAGFAQVYTVVDGFEGDVAKEGPNAGKRVVNGWKNAGLPWSYRLEKEKFTLPEPR